MQIADDSHPMKLNAVGEFIASEGHPQRPSAFADKFPSHRPAILDCHIQGKKRTKLLNGKQA